MADFKTALAALARGDVEFATVAKTIDKLLSRNPGAALQVLEQLREAYGEDLIDAGIYAGLKKCVTKYADRLDQVRESAAGKTVFDSGASMQLLNGAGTQGSLAEVDLDLSSDSIPPATDSSWPTSSSPEIESRPSGTGWGKPGEALQLVKIEPGMVLKERFTLDEILGVGGMGTVYKGRDMIKEEARDKNPYVALKVLNEDFKKHPDAFIALQREASRQQKLAHPNIATVYDFDRTAGGTVFLTMELLEGEPLNEFIKKKVRPRGGLPFTEAFPMIQGLGHALIYAHAHNIVHSDFKPGNCFITKGGIMKVLDFGIARAVKTPGQSEGEKTLFDPGKLGALTPAYASLEMLEEQEPDPRDDIYALACVAYELLMGRHPFNKLPATTARDNNLVPAPVKNLSRRQLRGLMRGLAFTREQRSQTVAQFLEELEGKRSPFKNPFILAPAAVILIALAGVYPALNVLHNRDVNRRIELARSDPGAIPAVLRGLQDDALDEADRNRVLVAARNEILDFYKHQVSERVDLENRRHDFAGAKQIISELEAYEVYRDSQQVEELREKIGNDEKVLLAVQTEAFNRALEHGELLPVDDREDVHDALEVVSQFSPETGKVLKRRLPGAYAAAIDRAIVNEEFDLAKNLGEVGLQMLPDSKRLIDLQDKVSGARDRAERAAQILALAARIQDTIETADRLGALLPLQDDIQRLRQLDPAHGLLSEVAATLAPLVERDIEALNRSRDWGSADLMAGDYGPLLRATGLHDLNVRALKLRDELSREIDRLVAEITAAVAQRKLAPPAQPNATELLARLGVMARLDQRTAKARDLVARAHLREARLARAAASFDQARTQISDAQVLEPTAPVASLLDAELATVNDDAALDPGTRDRETAARRSAFDQADAALRQTVAALSPDVTAIGNALVELDRLESLSPADLRLDELRKQLARRVAAATEALGEAGGWSESAAATAVILTRDAIAYAPGSEVLTGKLGVFVARQREASVAAQRQYVEDRKLEVEALLAEAAADKTWSAELQQKMAAIEGLAEAGDEWLPQTRERIAAVYVAKARTMRETERFAEGQNLLDHAQRYAPGLAVIGAEREALGAASAAFEREQREQERLARVDGLKQTFTAQTNAQDVADATATLEHLKRELPGDDLFVSEQAPAMLGTAYHRLATSKARAGDFAAALKLARTGLNLQPRDQDLRLAVNEYTVRGNQQELARIFSAGGAYDLAGVLEKIVEVQKLDPQTYGEAEDEWAAKVAARIRELQDTDGESANAVLAQAQDVFAGNPEITALEPVAAAAAQPSKYGAEIQQAIDQALLGKARDLLLKASGEEAEHPDIVRLKGTYNARIQEAKVLYEEYKTAFLDRNYDEAKTIIDKALDTWADSSAFKKEQARVLAALAPGDALRQETAALPPPPSKNPCDIKLAGHGKRRKGTCYDMVAQKARGPLMVVVPAGGSFGEAFAIGKYEVTVGDFNLYCKLSGACQGSTGVETTLPITNVSLEQAQAYAKWLSERTGRAYRIPTSEEWAYAAEAAGQQPQKDYNCRIEQGGQILKGQSTMGVNTGKANGWGLYNYVGNAQEWVISEGGVTVRGGAFEDTFSKCSVTLEKPHDGKPDAATGFRLVQELG